MPPPKIISFGEVLWDLFPEGPRFGGAPANFACHAAILGGEVTIVSAVGDDARGREAIEILAGYGVDTTLIQVDPSAPTGTVGIKLDAKGKPTFIIYEGSAWDELAWKTGVEVRIEKADIIYFGTLGQRSETSRAAIRRALSVAERADIPRILDVNLRAPFFDSQLIRDSIKRASILKLSDEELEAVAGACGITTGSDLPSILRAVIEQFGLESIVMTRGAEGALFVSAEAVVDQSGFPAEVVDTVGAGDAFTAAFVLGMLGGETTKAILQNACQTASAICSQSGAIPIPAPTLN